MSESNPTYSKEVVLDGIEHIGHWLHVGEHVVVEDTVHVIHDGIVVADDFKAQFPTLAQETGAVAADLVQCKTLGAAIAAAVLGGGTNLAADAGVLAALVTDGPALIQAFADAGKLASTLNADIKQDAAAL